MSKSNFKPLSSQPNFPELERQVREYWNQIDAVNYVNNLRSEGARKVYLDGPITANGMPHYGHAITWSMKDVIPRYWSMKGYSVNRNLGWDCHGLPVEVEVEKKLGFVKKEDIEEYGIAKFNALCKASILEYQGAMLEYEARLGRWVDLTQMYSTMDSSFVESMWWSLKELYTQGLLYEGYKVVAYSTRAGTTLSSHEVADGGYKEIEDPAVTVAFRVVDAPNDYLLAWTTTPWTLPGNLLLAIGEDIVYSRVAADAKTYILAKSKIEEVFGGRSYKVLGDVSTAELLNMHYEPLFDAFSYKKAEGCFRVVLAAHATDSEGTGIVHLAPYGAEDFEILTGLGIELFDYLDETAHFTAQIPAYQGKFYKQANDLIISDLKTKGNLISHTTILHRVAMCYRTATPLIYKPIKSWYIAVSKIKDALVKNNESINWVPAHFQQGASYQWLANVRDWALSRKRYWGTPLPVWINDKTNDLVFIGSFEELTKLSGKTLDDPHRPYVDAITWEDKTSGGTYRRVPDVIDVWFDSGAVPFARHHYPFEADSSFDDEYVADYISEGTDQVRLWFYTMHVLGQALFKRVPYKNVCVSGMLLDKNGKKLSKSKKNYEPLENILDEFGGDALRYFLLTSPIVQGESPRFSKEALVDARKEFFLPLWNCVNYFLTYAQMHSFEPSVEIPSSSNALDQWIMARLKETTSVIDTSMASYMVMPSARSLMPLVNDLSVWYIRRSRDRLRQGDIQALQTLFYVLYTITRLSAPFTPFVAEVLFEALQLRSVTGLKTVHGDHYPEFAPLSVDEQLLLESMALTREVVSVALALRVTHNVKVRQPLAALYVTTQTDKDLKSLITADLVIDEVNVKELKFTEPDQEFPMLDSKDLRVFLDTNVSAELELEGVFRELVRKFQALRKDQNLNVSDKVIVTYIDEGLNKAALERFSHEFIARVGATRISIGNDYTVEKC